MWNSYLKIVCRSLFKNKISSTINLFALSIGLAAFLFICQFVAVELSYDKFHTKSNRIFRIINDRYQNGRLIQHSTYSYPAIGPAMARDYPEVETYTRLLVPGGETIIKADNQIFLGDKSLFVDNNFLAVFDFPLLIGERRSALKEKRSVILTEQIARKYFREDDLSKIVGKEIYWSTESQPYVVNGICQNPPGNSHLEFDILLSYSSLFSPEHRDPDESWTWSSVRSYLLLRPEGDPTVLASKFDDFCDRYFQGDKVTGSFEKFALQPLKDIYLYSDLEYEYATTSNGKAVWSMMLIAGIILIIAFLNYVNLTTARSLDRAKEVGVRKVMGAARTQLIKQFTIESISLSLLALLIAVLIVQILKPLFADALGISLHSIQDVVSVNSFAIVVLAIGVIAGIVISGIAPALLLSSYQPVLVLKGKFSRSSKGQKLRKALVVFQFTASCALVVATLIVSTQLDYVNKADLGIDIQNTMIVSPPMRTAFDSAYMGRVSAFKHAVRQLPQVIGASTSSHIPGQRPFRTFGIRLVNGPDQVQHTMNQLVVDEGFFKMYDIKPLAGRMFEWPDYNFDWNKVDKTVINRNAQVLLGKDMEDIIGTELSIGDKKWTIVGVVENFHQQSLHNPIEPILFTPDYGTFNPTSIRLSGSDYLGCIDQIKRAFEKSFPDNAFNYSFLEDSFNDQYNGDLRFGAILSIFTALAVVISCLGLIGLSAHSASQRTKEIGIRKVLGASVESIIALLSIDFMKLILFAAFLSIPVVYFPVKSWLMNYSHRISPGVFLFVLPVVALLLIAGLTITAQVLRAARTNPVDTLKSE